jgi:apolipoprotein D and lipocalin family protein
VASLGVTFQWPFEAGYHVIALDRDNYQYAMVSGPDRGYLWILSRTKALEPGIEQRLKDQAESLDYPVDELYEVDQSPPPC